MGRQVHRSCSSENHVFLWKEDRWEDRLSEHQIRGWRDVSAAALQGKVSQKRSALVQTPVSEPKQIIVDSHFRTQNTTCPCSQSSKAKPPKSRILSLGIGQRTKLVQ